MSSPDAPPSMASRISCMGSQPTNTACQAAKSGGGWLNPWPCGRWLSGTSGPTGCGGSTPWARRPAAPRRVVPLDAGELIDTAARSVEAADFGDLGDGDWEGRLRTLVTAIDGNDLHVVGRLMTREELLRGLRTRLLLAAERRRDPSVAEEVIEAPIVITGPARSGTTILFELLALDPGLRSPIAADVLHPASGAPYDARLAMAEAEQELWADVQPEFASMHELRADLPVECITLSSPSFGGSHWSMVLNDPGGWAPDIEADLAFHRAVLQSVQHGEPPRQWVLKTPGYLFLLDDLLRAYPDASVIFTHRDPAKTMPSTVSTTAMVQWLRTDQRGARRPRRAHRRACSRTRSTRSPGGATTARSPRRAATCASPTSWPTRSPRSATPMPASGASSRPSTPPRSSTTSPPSRRGSTASTATRRATGASTSPPCGRTCSPYLERFAIPLRGR